MTYHPHSVQIWQNWQTYPLALSEVAPLSYLRSAVAWSLYTTGPTVAGRPKTQWAQSSCRNVDKCRPSALLEKEGSTGQRKTSVKHVLTVTSKCYKHGQFDIQKENKTLMNIRYMTFCVYCLWYMTEKPTDVRLYLFSPFSPCKLAGSIE